MWSKGFEGWYFKHQKGDDTLAFIPGRAESGSFVQMLSPGGARQFDVPELFVSGGIIRAGECVFSPYGCRIELPGVSGELAYGKLTPLRSDIMGPFRFMPMECRHGVISMSHTLRGSVRIDGETHDFNGGMGYIEKDSGTSFPDSYQWLQCSDFPQDCSVMVSIARIPFYGGSFTGCISAVVTGGREYRLATYSGVRILASDETHIRLAQGPVLLELDIDSPHGGHPLRAPAAGRMTDVIRERSNAEVSIRLWERGIPVLAAQSSHASYEFVRPEAEK